jgi:hypothetical protein
LQTLRPKRGFLGTAGQTLTIIVGFLLSLWGLKFLDTTSPEMRQDREKENVIMKGQGELDMVGFKLRGM